MNEEQLIAFLKQNLKLTITKAHNAILENDTVSVKLILCSGIIAEDEVVI
jgi:hypothetical protein